LIQVKESGIRPPDLDPDFAHPHACGQAAPEGAGPYFARRSALALLQGKSQ
jgi:hypothetical protein